jgi:hypothetical protein
MQKKLTRSEAQDLFDSLRKPIFARLNEGDEETIVGYEPVALVDFANLVLMFAREPKTCERCVFCREGLCRNPLVTQDERPFQQRSGIGINSLETGALFVGAKFGCIHWSHQEKANGESSDQV